MAGWEQVDGAWYWANDDKTYDEQAPDGSSPPADPAAEPYAQQPAAAPQVAVYTPPTPDAKYIPAGLDSYQTSTSSSGSNTPQAARDKFGKDVATGVAGVDVAVDQEASAAATGLYGASLAQRRSIMSDEEYASAPSQFSVQSELAEANRQQQQRMVEMQQRLIQTEQAATAASERHVAQVAADYTGSVKQFAAMRVNPAQWWGNLSQGEQAGTLASVFVANFLGMRGRNTTVMDTINRAIDRNMDAQSQNIAHAGEVAGMYKTVYDMTVAQSSTAEEARARMRGFYLAQLQQDIGAELARYDAPLAQAKAAEAVAALDTAFEKNFADLRASWFERGVQAKNIVIDQAKAELQASARTYSSSQSQSAGAAKMIMGPGGVQFDEASLAFNPRDDKPYGMFHKGTSPKTKADLNGLAAASRGLTRNIDKLKIMVAKNGGIYKPEWFSEQVLDEAGTEIRSLLTMVAADYAIAMNGGSRPSDFDVKNAFKVVPLEGMLTRAKPESTYNMLINVAEEKYNDLAAVSVRKFQTEDETAWAAGYTGARPSVSADHVAGTRTGEPEARGGEIDTFVGLAHSKQANNAKESPSDDLKAKWAKVKADAMGAPEAPPIWFYALDSIAYNLKHSDPTRQQQAREALEAYSSSAQEQLGKDDGANYDHGQRELAVRALLGS